MIEGVACLCSRGLIHTPTVESVFDELFEMRCGEECGVWRLVTTKNLPIPKAQNIGSR